MQKMRRSVVFKKASFEVKAVGVQLSLHIFLQSTTWHITKTNFKTLDY